MPPDEGHIFRRTNEPHDGIDKLPPPPPWRDFVRSKEELRGRSYKASDKEVDVVNAALYLRRPLLVTGQPGVGKTSLAYAIAWQLKLGDVLVWPINTRSTLQQGLYDYDAIGRVHDAAVASRGGGQHANSPAVPPAERQTDIGRYMRLGPLGTALLGGDSSPNGKRRPRVLLVDEIDKSDVDLPNDLLNVLEEGTFGIRELERLPEDQRSVSVGTYDGGMVEVTDGKVTCDTFPIIVMTSNGERVFPPAFLRRCISMHIDEPQNRPSLERIVSAHLALKSEYRDAVDALIERFLSLSTSDIEQRKLATDQLLNAIYLAMNELDPMSREHLEAALLNDLGRGG